MQLDDEQKKIIVRVALAKQMWLRACGHAYTHIRTLPQLSGSLIKKSR